MQRKRPEQSIEFNDEMVDDSKAGRHIAKKSRRRWSGGFICKGRGVYIMAAVCCIMCADADPCSRYPPAPPPTHLHHEKIFKYIIKNSPEKDLGKNLCNVMCPKMKV